MHQLCRLITNHNYLTQLGSADVDGREMKLNLIVKVICI